MIPYIIYIVLTLILSIIFDGRENDNPHKRLWYGITCLYLILLAGLRYCLGGDTQSYMIDFDYVPTSSHYFRAYIVDQFVEHSYMPGWSLLNIFCANVFGTFYAVQLIQAFVVNTCIFYLFKRYTKHVFLCALLFGLTGNFFNFNTEVMREAFAICLAGIGMLQYQNGKKIQFYLLICIGLFFHLSAAFALLFPFIHFKDINLRLLSITLLLSFVLWGLSDLLMTYLPQYLNGELAIVAKVLIYSNSKSTIFGYLSAAIHYIICQGAIIYFTYKYMDDDDERKSHFAHYASFYLFTAITACGLAGFNRFLNYSIIFILIIVAEYIYHIKKQLTELTITKCVLLLLFFFFPFLHFNIYMPETEKRFYEFFVPYTSVLNEQENVDYRLYMYYEAVGTEKSQKNTRDY